jgi:hypothetical protein
MLLINWDHLKFTLKNIFFSLHDTEKTTFQIFWICQKHFLPIFSESTAPWLGTASRTDVAKGLVRNFRLSLGFLLMVRLNDSVLTNFFFYRRNIHGYIHTMYVHMYVTCNTCLYCLPNVLAGSWVDDKIWSLGVFNLKFCVKWNQQVINLSI